MVVAATVEGQAQTAPAVEMIGRTATALTALAPSGFVDVAGHRYEAFSRGGFVDRGAALKIVGLDNFRLIVAESKTP